MVPRCGFLAFLVYVLVLRLGVMSSSDKQSCFYQSTAYLISYGLFASIKLSPKISLSPLRRVLKLFGLLARLSMSLF